jgi:hypothetical protein
LPVAGPGEVEAPYAKVPDQADVARRKHRPPGGIVDGRLLNRFVELGDRDEDGFYRQLAARLTMVKRRRSPGP